MNRMVSPVFIALAGLGLVIAFGALVMGYAAFERKAGDLTADHIDGAMTEYAADLVDPLCRFAGALTEYSSTNDVERFNAALQAIRPASDAAVRAAVDYAASVRRKTEGKHDPQSYAIIRAIERIWQAAHETDSTISSAADWAERARNEKLERPYLDDWAKLAIQSEALLIHLGGDRDQGTCAKTSASEELIKYMSHYRRDAEGHLHAVLQDYHTHAAYLARGLAQDPSVSQAERQAAADDLKIREQAYRTDFEGPTRRATIRLFGVVPY